MVFPTLSPSRTARPLAACDSSSYVASMQRHVVWGRSCRGGGRGNSSAACSTSGGGRRSRQPTVSVRGFAVMKALGVSAPKWIPDWGVDARKAVLTRFFGPINREVGRSTHLGEGRRWLTIPGRL